jgi:glucokinase
MAQRRLSARGPAAGPLVAARGAAVTARACTVAIDLGGTSMKGALVASDGTVLARIDAPTPAAAGGQAVLTAVLALARALAAAGTREPALAAVSPAAGSPTAAGPIGGAGDGEPIRVVGAAAITPGQVHDGVVRFAANLGWRDVPLAAELSAALGVPAAVEHDAAGAALAEAAHGNRGADCLFVALGTGIGSGHVRDGRVATGSTGGAGELGHIPVYPDGEPCACGQRGCLEVYASAAAVARRYAATRAATGDPVPETTADAVVARLDSDPVARAVWVKAIEALALALATTTLLVDPGVIVLGGGLARAGDALLKPLSGRLAARLAWREPPPLELSALGTDAGWRGASLLARAVAT